MVGIAACCPGAAAVSSGGTGYAPKPPRPHPAAAKALAGRGMWIWYVSESNGGDLGSIAATSQRYGLSTLMIKSGDGSSVWSQFNPQLVSTLHAQGLSVCAWQYVYGDHPIFEAEVGAAAVHDGADCLLIDAEDEYDGKYVQAQEYIKKLRQLIGSSFPVALASFPYVDYHPGLPYSVFLGPGGAQYNAPQMYWPDIGTSVDTVYSHTFEYNRPFARPIEPLGETAGDPSPAQVERFRQLSRAYGADSVSWWDWQETSSRDWVALSRPVGSLTNYRPDTSFATLSVSSQGGLSSGDLVVWAQEHLYRAGFHIQIDGSFGPKTRQAVEQFQGAHGLPVSGVIDSATWQALLRYPPVNVTWVSHNGNPTAVASRDSLLLPVPASAREPTKRYEIPPHLGQG